MRNVVEHLPEEKRPWARAAMRRAWEAGSCTKALAKLRQLANQLEEPYPSAARSVLEGAEETLTVIDLGLTGWLLRTFSSTNAIENLQSAQKRMARNVKRWRSGKMVLRWVGVALLQAEKNFRRVKSYKDMPAMLRALEARVKIAMDNKRQVA
jgi:putative transposase